MEIHKLQKLTILKYVFIILCFLPITLFSDQSERNKTTYTAAVLKDFPPLYKLNKDSQPEGFAIDILNEISKEMEFDVDYLLVENWKEAMEAVRLKNADFIPGIGISDARKKEFIFTSKMESIPISCFVRRKDKRIKKISDLKNSSFKAGVINQSAAMTSLQKQGGFQLVTFHNIDSAMNSLLAGEIDAFIFPEPVLKNKLRNLGIENHLIVVGEPLKVLYRGYLFGKDKTSMVENFNIYIENLIESERYLTLYTKWYGEKKANLINPKTFITIILIFLLVIIFVIFYKNRTILHINKKLTRSEEKLNALFSAMTEMVVIHDLVFNNKGEPVNYMIIDCNKAFTDITGIAKEQAIYKLATEVYGCLEAPYLDIYSEVAITGKPFTYDTFYPPMEKHFRISVVSPEKNKFATITSDITTIKQIEEALSNKNKELENYLYIASHDLRSPMVNIQGFSQRLQNSITKLDQVLSNIELDDGKRDLVDEIINTRIDKSLKFILTNVHKMDSLIKGLLQISRTGRIKMTINEIDTKKLLQNVVQSFNYELDLFDSEVNIKDIYNCFGDETLLNQLFSNIIGNSIKYRDKNRKLEIDISSEIKNNKVYYTFKDNGIGIPDKYHDKIWDVFFRVDPKFIASGEGIGLSIVKRIADKHKGKISIDSKLGVGTTITVILNKTNFAGKQKIV